MILKIVIIVNVNEENIWNFISGEIGNSNILNVNTIPLGGAIFFSFLINIKIKRRGEVDCNATPRFQEKLQYE